MDCGRRALRVRRVLTGQRLLRPLTCNAILVRNCLPAGNRREELLLDARCVGPSVGTPPLDICVICGHGRRASRPGGAGEPAPDEGDASWLRRKRATPGPQMWWPTTTRSAGCC